MVEFGGSRRFKDEVVDYLPMKFNQFAGLNLIATMFLIDRKQGAPPQNSVITDDGLPPVWPHRNGTACGQGLHPIYRSVPDAAHDDAVFHEWLALVDAIRAGRARERELATRMLKERLA